MDLLRLSQADYRRTPWKNGGGVTLDIAGEHRPGAEPGGWSGVVWRFGRTRIERPGPFSDLSGHDRVLSVVAGRGLALVTSDDRRLDVTEPFRPVRFPGEWAIRSELADGPVEVLNLIGDRASVALDLAFLDAGAALTAGPGHLVLHAPAGEAVLDLDGSRLTIPAGDAVRIEADRGLALVGRAGRAAVARIMLQPRSEADAAGASV